MRKTLIFRIFLFIVGLILLLDGAILLAYKKVHLGTILPFLIGAVFCLSSIFSNKIQQFLSTRPRLAKLWRWGWIGLSAWLISLFAFFIYIASHSQQPLPQQKIADIIVLGSGIVQGQASPTLALRLDRAALLAQQYPQALIIVSGGLDYGEVRTEAAVMSDYLQHNFQIHPTRIALEAKSTSTELNLKNSQPILVAQQLSLNSPIAIVTSDFHTLRASAIANKQGYKNVESVSANTPLSTRYNAWLREYFAYISGWLLAEY